MKLSQILMNEETPRKSISESVAADSIWKKLMAYKDSHKVDDADRCTIDANDEKQTKQNIKDYLDKGWTEAEVYTYFKWSECFDDYIHDEDQCIQQMNKIKKQVETRLASK